MQAQPREDLDEPNLDPNLTVLDHFNSDLHLKIDADGYAIIMSIRRRLINITVLLTRSQFLAFHDFGLLSDMALNRS